MTSGNPAGERSPAALIRAVELRQVTEALIQGRSVLIDGPAGIGKTRLLAAALAAVTASDRRVVGLTATAAVSGIPLGALMSLIDDGAELGSPVQRALAVRRGVLARRIDVLAIDDAHLLDAASAGVVHELAASGLTIAVAARSGLPLHDAITLLAKDGGGLRCELLPLGADDVRAAATAELGGDVDEGLLRALAARSAGNPLALSALLRDGLARGVVAFGEGSWRLRGRLPIVAELVELMRLPVDRLSSSARDAAELVALADGLPLAILLELVDGRAVDEAESGDVLAMSGAEGVRVRHPLIGDALLAMLPTVRRRSHLARLVAALDGSADPADQVAVARWSTELGRDVPAQRLLDLAGVVTVNDPETSEFLLRAAIERGAGTVGSIRLAEVLTHQHRPDDAIAVLDSIDLDALDPPSALAVQLTRAFLLIMPMQLPSEGLALLDDLREDSGSFPLLEAFVSTALWRCGRLDEAHDRGRSVIDDPASPDDAVAHALLTSATLRIYDGDAAGFEAHLPRLLELTARERASLPEGEDATRLLAAIAPLYSTLDLECVRRVAGEGYARELARGDDGTRAQYAMQLGRAALIAGDAVEGVRHLREAAGARGVWCIAVLPLTRSYLVSGLVLSGAQQEAEQVGRLLDSDPRVPYLDPEAEVAAAAILAGRGELRGAAARAVAAARSVPNGAAGIAAHAWYEALRYGHPDAAWGFLAATEGMTGSAREAQRAHARATAARDPLALEASSRALVTAGLGGYAVDAMASAIRAHRARDDAMATMHALERLRFLRAQFPHYDSPVARGLDRPALTEREAEIARLASLGNSDREIAAELGIAVRTVETHLSRVYGKLAVRGRGELGPVLTGSRPT